MRATDVVGWVQDGASYCAEHKPAGYPDPIFAAEERWESMVCDVPGCGYLDPDADPWEGEEPVQCDRCQEHVKASDTRRSGGLVLCVYCAPRGAERRCSDCGEFDHASACPAWGE